MKFNKFLIYSLIVLAAITPVIFLLVGKEGGIMNGYGPISHVLGQITGLIGMTLFAITFIFPTRMKFVENALGGLDKVYKTHGVIGGLALIFILFHPLLLVANFIPNKINLAVKYLLPSTYWSVNFGIIALVGMIVLICLTLYFGIKYNKWKVSHKFLGVVFILAALHVFLVRTTIAQDNIFDGYYLYSTIVSVIGLGGFSYSTLFRNKFSSHAFYRIKSINKIGNGVHEIVLSPQNKSLRYKSGQFVFVEFENKKLGKEAHPFSITSNYNNPNLKVIIKGLGDFTNKISELNIGDRVRVEGPYGGFNYENGGTNQVWIAGGVGITPFISMAEGISSNRKINAELYYTAKSKEDLIHIEDFKKIESKNPNFKVISWLSNEKGYLTVKELSKKNNLLEKEFFICGPQKLKDDFTRDLIKLGVKKRKIHQEEFKFK